MRILGISPLSVRASHVAVVVCSILFTLAMITPTLPSEDTTMVMTDQCQGVESLAAKPDDGDTEQAGQNADDHLLPIIKSPYGRSMYFKRSKGNFWLVHGFDHIFEPWPEDFALGGLGSKEIKLWALKQKEKTAQSEGITIDIQTLGKPETGRPPSVRFSLSQA